MTLQFEVRKVLTLFNSVLQSIYDDAIQLRQPSQDAIEHLDGQQSLTIRYEVSLS
jgi:hypothetical protein